MRDDHTDKDSGLAKKENGKRQNYYRRLNSDKKWLIVCLALTLNTTWIAPKVFAQERIEIKIERVFIKKVEVTGSTVFTNEELAQVTKSFERQYVTPEQLLAIRAAITDLYVQKGYITSGAILPPQDLINGVVRVKVIEGSLEQIEIKGLTHLNKDYVRSRLARFTSTPLNINDLEDGLKLLQIDPLFEDISASLEVGSKPSQSILVLTLTEAPPVSFSLSLDNSQPQSVGAIRGEAEIVQINLLGIGDRAYFNYNLSQGVSEFNVGYKIPLNALDGTFSIAYQNQHSRIIEKPFESLNINAKYNQLSFIYRQPIINTSDQELALSLSFYLKENKTFIFDDKPFSFSPDAKNGETRVRTLNFTQEWVSRSSERVLAVSSNFSYGFNILDATSSGFFLWLGQFQWLQKLTQDTILVTQLSAQLTPDQLLPVEQFTMGGVYTVRGYPRDIKIGDNAIVGSIEARFTLVRDENFGNLELTPFFDIGTVWNNQGNISSPSTLASVGLQLGWEGRDLRAKISYGIQLIPIDKANSFEDNFYFLLQWIPIRF